MAKLKRSQLSPPGPNCAPGLAKMRARLATRSATSSGCQAGAGEIDPGEIGRVEPHRAGARRRRLDAPVEQVAVLLQIGQQRVEPGFARAPAGLRRDHAEGVVGAEPAGRDARVELGVLRSALDVKQAPTWAPARLKVLVAATQVIRRSAISGAAVSVGDVPGAVEHEIAVDLVGDEDQVALGADVGQRLDLARATRPCRRDCAGCRRTRSSCAA